MGPEGMKAAGDRLKRAISSAVDPPPEVLEQFPLADTESITFLPLTYYNYTTEDQVGVWFYAVFFFLFCCQNPKTILYCVSKYSELHGLSKLKLSI